MEITKLVNDHNYVRGCSRPMKNKDFPIDSPINPLIFRVDTSQKNHGNSKKILHFWMICPTFTTSKVSPARLQPTITTYNASISACQKAATWPVALHLFYRLQASMGQMEACHPGKMVGE